MIEIRHLQLEDCSSVAEAHLKYLTTSFRGKAGLALLKIYYEVITEQPGGMGFVVVKDGKLAGYICGVWDRAMLKKALLRRWFKLIVYGVRQSLQVPRTIPGFFTRLFRPRTKNVLKVDGYELRPIVVLPEFRGQGIAEQLVQRLLNDARRRGFKQVFLIVEVNNPGAEKLYRKSGFFFERQIDLTPMAVKLFQCSV